MKVWHTFICFGVAAIIGAVAWHTVRVHAQRPNAAPPSNHAPATQPPSNPQQAVSPHPAQGAGKPSSATQEQESERRLGPFSIAGKDYTAVLHSKKRQPGTTDETGDTVFAMEIQDAAGTIQYRRKFSYQEANEAFSDAWLVGAGILAGANGTGLLVSYSEDSEPSAPEEEQSGWWQVFGVVNGAFKPFGAPVKIQGGLLPTESNANGFRTAGPLDSHADALEFKVWTGHFRLIFPVRIDWAQGKLTPAQGCDEQAARIGLGEVGACQYGVLPEDDRQVSDTTFVTLCKSPGEKCENSEKVVVKDNSKVDLLSAQVKAEWNAGAASGKSGSMNGPADDMRDAGGVGVSPNDDMWLKVRIDGKEGWMHGVEDFHALGLPEDE
jgi:hypothetical protein